MRATCELTLCLFLFLSLIISSSQPTNHIQMSMKRLSQFIIHLFFSLYVLLSWEYKYEWKSTKGKKQLEMNTKLNQTNET